MTTLTHVFAFTGRRVDVARWYEEVLELIPVRREDSVWFETSGSALVVHDREDEPGDASLVPWFHVADLAAAYERAGSSTVGPLRSGYFFARDPDGRVIGIRQRRPEITTETLRDLLAAFNAHDLDRIMSFFADDCVLEMPRGSDPHGTRYEGKPAVRAGLATRFAGVPDVHYGDDAHWVHGDHAVSTWLLTGTTTGGRRLDVRGCDLFDLREGRIVRKDSYWKIVE
jgi:ketosteroid isomerase-like protein